MSNPKTYARQALLLACELEEGDGSWYKNRLRGGGRGYGDFSSKDSPRCALGEVMYRSVGHYDDRVVVIGETAEDPVPDVIRQSDYFNSPLHLAEALVRYAQAVCPGLK